jgi:hypothetical protein
MFHHGEMDSIARRQLLVSQHNFFGAFHRNPVNGQYQIDNSEQSVEGRLDGLAPPNSCVPVQDLLQNLSIRDEALPLADELFQ